MAERPVVTLSVDTHETSVSVHTSDTPALNDHQVVTIEEDPHSVISVCDQPEKPRLSFLSSTLDKRLKTMRDCTTALCSKKDDNISHMEDFSEAGPSGSHATLDMLFPGELTAFDHSGLVSDVEVIELPPGTAHGNILYSFTVLTGHNNQMF